MELNKIVDAIKRVMRSYEYETSMRTLERKFDDELINEICGKVLLDLVEKGENNGIKI